MKDDSEYISDEERREFRDRIGQYLRPPANKDNPAGDDSGDDSGGDAAEGASSAGSARPVFLADAGIHVNRREDPHEDDDFKRAGLRDGQMAKLKAGRISADRALDLHGCYVADAARAMTRFINQAYADGYECVKVIHGKGSAGGRGADAAAAAGTDGLAMLKRYVIAWLKDNDVVLGFCRALPQDGGGGATYVLLSRSR